MPKVSGPLFSMDASGQLGQAIVYSRWKGRPYVRSYAIPTNPKSAAQKGTRSMMAFLAEDWKNLSAPDQATWDAAAAAKNYSPFNAYVAANMDRWTQFEGAGKTDPVGGTGTVASGVTTPALGGVGQITFSDDLVTVNDNWGIVHHLSLSTGFTPSRDNAQKIVEFTSGPQNVVVLGLDPGTWYYRSSLFTDDGLLADSGVVEGSVVVT